MRVVFFILMIFCYFNNSYANIIMTGNRIIYNGSEKLVDVELSNHSHSTPYAVQSWVADYNNSDADMNNLEGVPFFVTPSMYLAAPESSRIVRILFNGKKELPKDRESVYSFIFSQVPPTSKKNVDASQVMVVIKSKVKLFYRPQGLKKYTSSEILSALAISKISNDKLAIKISNPTPYYISIGNLNFESSNGTKTATIFQHGNNFIAPFSQSEFKFNTTSAANGKLNISIITDKGTNLSHSYKL